MSFEGRQIDFREADRRYDELKQQYDAGVLDADAFDTQLRELMIQDRQGRWWAKTRETGRWMYYEGNAWVPGTPSDPDYRQGMSNLEPQAQTQLDSPFAAVAGLGPLKAEYGINKVRRTLLLGCGLPFCLILGIPLLLLVHIQTRQ